MYRMSQSNDCSNYSSLPVSSSTASAIIWLLCHYCKRAFSSEESLLNHKKGHEELSLQKGAPAQKKKGKTKEKPKPRKQPYVNSMSTRVKGLNFESQCQPNGNSCQSNATLNSKSNNDCIQNHDDQGAVALTHESQKLTKTAEINVGPSDNLASLENAKVMQEHCGNGDNNVQALNNEPMKISPTHPSEYSALGSTDVETQANASTEGGDNNNCNVRSKRKEVKVLAKVRSTRQTNPHVLVEKLASKEVGTKISKGSSDKNKNKSISRKPSTCNVNPNSKTADLQIQPPVVKRGRGRPRKIQNVQPDSVSIPNKTVSIKEERQEEEVILPLSSVPTPPPSSSPESSENSMDLPNKSTQVVVVDSSDLKTETPKNHQDENNGNKSSRYSIREKRSRVCYTEFFPCGKCTREFCSEQELKVHEKWCRKLKYEADNFHEMNMYEVGIAPAPTMCNSSSIIAPSYDRDRDRDIKPEIVKPKTKVVKVKKPPNSRRILKRVSCENYKPEDLTNCTSCDKQIPIAFLVAHLKLCWSNEPQEESSEDEVEEEVEEEIVVPQKISIPQGKGTMNPFQWKHQCPVCSRYFWLRPHLTKHMEEHELNLKEVKVNVEHNKRDIAINKIVQKKRRGDVRKCVSVAEKLAALRRKKNPILFKCDKCRKYFKTKSRIEAHKKKKHPELNLFVCSICDQGCRTLEEADIHAKLHNGERPFPCDADNCSESFTRADYLTAHQLVAHLNSNPNPKEPQIANKGRPKKKSLSSLNERRYVCKICSKVFPGSQCLTQHMASHSDVRAYKCSYEGCNAAYKGRQKLREHVRLHTGETPYECEFCGKGYARQFSYRMHVRRHQGFYDKFQCTTCTRKFSSQWSFQQHKGSCGPDAQLAS